MNNTILRYIPEGLSIQHITETLEYTCSLLYYLKLPEMEAT